MSTQQIILVRMLKECGLAPLAVRAMQNDQNSNVVLLAIGMIFRLFLEVANGMRSLCGGLFDVCRGSTERL